MPPSLRQIDGAQNTVSLSHNIRDNDIRHNTHNELRYGATQPPTTAPMVRGGCLAQLPPRVWRPALHRSMLAGRGPSKDDRARPPRGALTTKGAERERPRRGPRGTWQPAIQNVSSARDAQER